MRAKVNGTRVPFRGLPPPRPPWPSIGLVFPIYPARHHGGLGESKAVCSARSQFHRFFALRHGLDQQTVGKGLFFRTAWATIRALLLLPHFPPPWELASPGAVSFWPIDIFIVNRSEQQSCYRLRLAKRNGASTIRLVCRHDVSAGRLATSHEISKGPARSSHSTYLRSGSLFVLDVSQERLAFRPRRISGAARSHSSTFGISRLASYLRSFCCFGSLPALDVIIGTRPIHEGCCITSCDSLVRGDGRHYPRLRKK